MLLPNAHTTVNTIDTNHVFLYKILCIDLTFTITVEPALIVPPSVTSVDIIR